MIRSMTGYGTGESVLPDGSTIRVEIRTVNHRHLNANLRLPTGWDALEAPINARLREVMRRGHVNLNITLEMVGRSDDLPYLNMDRARSYADLLREMQETLDLGGAVDVNTLARFSDIYRPDRIEEGAPELDVLLPALNEALKRVLELREKEGARLAEDLRRALKRIGEELDVVETLAPDRLTRERDRLRDRVQHLAESVEVDEDRLAREIAYLAEKWDLNEEIVRFRSHIELFEETLASGNEGKAGKRLGFIVQEMNREANTIGSKANDQGIGAAAVAIKEELERLREQLENVE